MARIGKNLTAEIKEYIEQVVETRFGYNQSAQTYAPSGDDSPPLPNDRIVLVQVDGSGNFVAVGSLVLSQGAKPGEKILFSRDGNGKVKAILSLLNDGKIKLESPDGVSVTAKNKTELKTDDKLEMEAKGDVKIKGKEMELNSTHTKLTGGIVECGGVVSPSGSGAFCALAVCPVTGATHIGDKAQGA